jgi:hypothetical protein
VSDHDDRGLCGDRAMKGLTLSATAYFATVGLSDPLAALPAGKAQYIALAALMPIAYGIYLFMTSEPIVAALEAVEAKFEAIAE